MIRLVVLLGILVGLAILLRKRPTPNSGHWLEPDDASWDDEGLWSRVAGSMPL